MPSSKQHPGQPAEPHTIPASSEAATIPIVAETATIGKRTVETGRAVVRKSVAEHDEVIEALLERHDVEIERVPVGRVVAAPPPARQEGDTWVLPILEEELVVEKRLVLREELRIRTVTTQQKQQKTVRLRREVASIETQGGGPDQPDRSAR